MECTVEWGGYPQDVLVTTAGTASLADLKAMIDEVLGEERYRPGLKVLVDHSRLEEDTLTEDDMREIARYVRERREELTGTIIAVVTPSQAHYGLTRMWRTYALQELPNTVGVFYSLDGAAEWLRRIPG